MLAVNISENQGYVHITFTLHVHDLTSVSAGGVDSGVVRTMRLLSQWPLFGTVFLHLQV